MKHKSAPTVHASCSRSLEWSTGLHRECMRHVPGVWNGAQVCTDSAYVMFQESGMGHKFRCEKRCVYTFKRHLEDQVKYDNELKLLMVSVPSKYTATDTLSVSPYLKKVNNNESIIYYTHKPLVINSNTNSFLLFLHNFPFNGID